MVAAYFISALIFFSTIKSVVQSIKTKKYGELLLNLLVLPFQFFFLISLIFGGSAFNDAANEYELYQAGHYYLVNHGQWVEVSYGKYMFVLVSEIVGISSFVIAFILNLIRIFINGNE